MHKLIFAALVAFSISLLSACTQKHPRSKFPALVSLDTFKSAQFVPTLDHVIPENRNVVYTPAFLYAWNELQTLLPARIEVLSRSGDLEKINKSAQHIDKSLREKYTAHVEKSGDSVTINSAFTETLKFAEVMDTTKGDFMFAGTRVKAFGMPYYDYDLSEQIHILYYESDDHFIAGIFSKDEKKEVLFAKGYSNASTFREVVKNIEVSIEKGQTDKQQDGSEWKYYLHDEDVFLAPVISFNYKQVYGNILGNKIESGGKVYRIISALQRTACIINESGTEVASEAEVTLEASEEWPEEKHKAKRLLLDKPFILLMRNRKENEPYFIMKVTNPSIMTSQ